MSGRRVVPVAAQRTQRPPLDRRGSGGRSPLPFPRDCLGACSWTQYSRRDGTRTVGIVPYRAGGLSRWDMGRGVVLFKGGRISGLSSCFLFCINEQVFNQQSKSLTFFPPTTTPTIKMKGDCGCSGASSCNCGSSCMFSSILPLSLAFGVQSANIDCTSRLLRLLRKISISSIPTTRLPPNNMFLH
ncbi:hypothetical protein EV126DRAFT_429818 [Verticillium dahliae]|nr:hypothetical protein EV126DRAFT_429818 [Verticillium dahliae]